MPEMYVKYNGDEIVGYVYGEPWIAQALFMDDIGYPTEEEAIEMWEKLWSKEPQKPQPHPYNRGVW